jgi:peptidoglycan hydrolase CwlO-like protein
MPEWIPLVAVALLALLGNGLSFYFSRQERKAKTKVNSGTYYSTLVSDLQTEIQRYKNERDEALKKHEKAILKLEKNIVYLEREIDILKNIITNR